MTNATPLTPTQIALALAIVMTWVGHFITLWKFRNDLRAAEEKRNDDLVKLITTIAKREVESYHHTEEHGRRLESRIQTTMRLNMDEEFSRRSSSFVDAKGYEARHNEVRDRINRLEEGEKSTARELGALTNQLTELNAFLQFKFGFKGDRDPRKR